MTVDMVTIKLALFQEECGLLQEIVPIVQHTHVIVAAVGLAPPSQQVPILILTCFITST